MISIFLSWILLLVLFSIIGNAWNKLMWSQGLYKNYQFRLLRPSWIGIIFVTAILQIYSIFFPIALGSWLLIFLVWLICLAYSTNLFEAIAYKNSNTIKKQQRNKSKNKYTHSIFRLPSQNTVWYVVIGFGFMISFCYYASLVPVWPDTYLYHFQSVRWINEYPAVFGLANLHFRLGLDSSFFIYSAFINNGFLYSKGIHIGLSFLLVLLFIDYLNQLKETNSILEKTFYAVTLPFLILKGWSSELASYSTDLAMSIFFLVLLTEIIHFKRSSLITVLLIAAFLMTIKMSGLMPLILVGGWIILNMIIKRISFSLKRTLIGVVLLIFILSGHVAREIIATGWPLFPISILPISVTGSLSKETLHSVSSEVTAWARLPGERYRESLTNGFYFWFIPWLTSFQKVFEYKLLQISIVAVVFVLIQLNIFKALIVKNERFLLSFGITLSSILLWFSFAPDVRFGAVFFWCLAALTVYPIFFYLNERSKIAHFALYLFTAIILSYATSGPLLSMGLSPFMLPDPVTSGTHIEMMEGETNSAILNVRVPDPPSDLCGNVALPCTPYPNRKLKLIDSSDLGSGFYLDK